MAIARSDVVREVLGLGVGVAALRAVARPGGGLRARDEDGEEGDHAAEDRDHEEVREGEAERVARSALAGLLYSVGHDDSSIRSIAGFFSFASFSSSSKSSP